ncbi:pectinesterase inhibitor 9-like [Nicotiana tabacum]|uniref:21 kDa protein-like n=1 Tax=Nicotiana tabacum TaxID=4097 RepID=A0A1S4AAJ3_TOBAC|nr:PREDICTED: 21 kDa protein-like [Nicotiana tabacum]
MGKINIPLLLFVLSVVAVVESSTSRLRPHSTFIETQCRRTRYPEPCVTFLSKYVNPTSQDPQEIAQAALKVSLVRALHTKAYIAKVCKEPKQMKAKDYQAIRECFVHISHGVSQLTNAVKELQNLKLDGQLKEFLWHQNNVQTWLSTVLTDVYTCMDGLSGFSKGGKVKATIKAKVLNVAQVTSNALALFNGFAAKYKTSHHASYDNNKP